MAFIRNIHNAKKKYSSLESFVKSKDGYKDFCYFMEQKGIDITVTMPYPVYLEFITETIDEIMTFNKQTS